MRLEVSVRARRGTFALEAEFASEATVTALFGPSGSGKTSVLNAIAGLLKPQAGRIALDGRVFSDGSGIWLPPQQRRVGYVFQEGRLLPHLSVRQNLLYGRFFLPAAERSADYDRVVALLDLGHLLGRRPHNLSGGEKQRVAIGRALLASPRLLLLDEPLAALDAPRKGEILYYIERLRDEVGLPMVYVSHAIEEVVRLADTVITLADGKVVERGGAVGRLEDGAVLEARVVQQDLQSGLARLQFTGGALEIPDVQALIGERVRVRVRSRDVSLAVARPAGLSIRNVLAGTIVSVAAEEGASLDVELDIGGTRLIARITRKSAAELGLRSGLPVFALVKSVSIDRRSVGYA